MSDEASPIRILVVDDHPVVRAGIESLMTGHADMIIVAQAANGREAIQHFRTHRPDVTLMDIQMPEMNVCSAKTPKLRAARVTDRDLDWPQSPTETMPRRPEKTGLPGLPIKGPYENS